MGGRNRIVVDYGDTEDLVLLGVIDTKTGKEESYGDMVNTYSDEFTIVKRYDELSNVDVRELRNLEEDNKEGFVIKFSSDFRMKIKFEEYCRLHSIVTNVSNKTIWEYLKDNRSFEELLTRVPDEFYSWVEKTKKELEEAYKNIELESVRFMSEAMSDMILKGETTKKDFALRVKNHKYSGIIFRMYEKKEYSYIIWKMIKPEYGRPFKDGYDQS